MATGDRYVTVTPAVAPKKFNVSVCKETDHEEYVIVRISAALPEIAAKALAQSWAVAMQLEIR